jgi:hypothetical protein
VTPPACRNSREGALWVEVLLLAPFVGLLLLGVLEVRHAMQIEAMLARTANSVAEAGEQAVAIERRALSSSLKLPQDTVQIDAQHRPDGSHIKVTVPYALTGSTLAFLWPDAVATGESRRR